MDAHEFMTGKVETVHQDDEIREVLNLLGRVPFSGFPVVDDKARIVGVVTEHDFVEVFQPEDRTLWIPVGFPPFLETMKYGVDVSWDEFDIGIDLLRTARKAVSEVMSSPAVTVYPETSLSEVVALLADSERDINRLPVVDEEDRVVGIITRQDVLRELKERNLV